MKLKSDSFLLPHSMFHSFSLFNDFIAWCFSVVVIKNIFIFYLHSEQWICCFGLGYKDIKTLYEATVSRWFSFRLNANSYTAKNRRDQNISHMSDDKDYFPQKENPFRPTVMGLTRKLIKKSFCVYQKNKKGCR